MDVADIGPVVSPFSNVQVVVGNCARALDNGIDWPVVVAWALLLGAVVVTYFIAAGELH